jgi:hypothetical protein
LCQIASYDEASKYLRRPWSQDNTLSAAIMYLRERDLFNDDDDDEDDGDNPAADFEW